MTDAIHCGVEDMEGEAIGKLKAMIEAVEDISYKSEKKELLADTIQYMSGYLYVRN